MIAWLSARRPGLFGRLMTRIADADEIAAHYVEKGRRYRVGLVEIADRPA